MEEQIQNQVSLLIGKYGWLLLVGVVTLLFRSTIEKCVAGFMVFMCNDYNEDDVVEVDGRPGRIVRCGIWTTTFFLYDVVDGIIFTINNFNLARQENGIERFRTRSDRLLRALEPTPYSSFVLKYLTK